MNRLIVCLLTALLAPLSACGKIYSAEPITAYVVDADTGKPLEGVIVVAHWELEGGMHVDRVGQMEIMETVTDKDGRFHFAGWGPKPIPPGLPGNARLTIYDPALLFYKQGFKPAVEFNKLTTAALRGEGPPLRKSDWNGKTIKLEKFTGGLEDRSRSLGNLDITLGFVYNGKNCEWKMTPRMIVAMHREKLIFRQNEVANSLMDIDHFETWQSTKCGSVKSFLEEYLK